MAKTVTAPAAAPETKTAEYEFVPEYVEEGKPRTLFVDDTRGKRVPVKPGTRFVAELAQVTVLDRRWATPKEVATGAYYVVASDIDVAPGCLTSCIRTGRAVPVK